MLVVAATLNEADTIADLVARVLAVSPALEMLVVDDDSPDGTQGIVARMAETEPRLHLLSRRGCRGLGGAIMEGFQFAVAHGFEIAVNMDADFSHDPDDIPRLLAALEPLGGRPADVVVGSRRVPGGQTLGWPLSRHAISRLVCWFTRFVLRVPVRDASSGFRAVRLAIVERLPADLSTGYAFFEQMLWSAHRAGGRIVEVPITFTNRKHGTSKAGLRVAAEGAWQLLRLGAATWLPSGSSRRA